MDTLIEIEIIKTAVSDAIALCGTQRLLAKKSGLSQSAISKLYRGASKPRGEAALALEKACDYAIHRSRFAPHIFKNEDAA